MIEPTNIAVVQAEDGAKALAIELVLIVPFDDVFGASLAQQLLGGDDQPTTPTTPTTEQDNTEDTNA